MVDRKAYYRSGSGSRILEFVYDVKYGASGHYTIATTGTFTIATAFTTTAAATITTAAATITVAVTVTANLHCHSTRTCR